MIVVVITNEEQAYLQEMLVKYRCLHSSAEGVEKDYEKNLTNDLLKKLKERKLVSKKKPDTRCLYCRGKGTVLVREGTKIVNVVCPECP